MLLHVYPLTNLKENIPKDNTLHPNKGWSWCWEPDDTTYFEHVEVDGIIVTLPYINKPTDLRIKDITYISDVVAKEILDLKEE